MLKDGINGRICGHFTSFGKFLCFFLFLSGNVCAERRDDRFRIVDVSRLLLELRCILRTG